MIATLHIPRISLCCRSGKSVWEASDQHLFTWELMMFMLFWPCLGWIVVYLITPHWHTWCTHVLPFICQSVPSIFPIFMVMVIDLQKLVLRSFIQKNGHYPYNGDSLFSFFKCSKITLLHNALWMPENSSMVIEWVSEWVSESVSQSVYFFQYKIPEWFIYLLCSQGNIQITAKCL